MNAVLFFKSMWPEVKRNAALFVGMRYPDSSVLYRVEDLYSVGSAIVWGTCMVWGLV